MIFIFWIIAIFYLYMSQSLEVSVGYWVHINSLHEIFFLRGLIQPFDWEKCWLPLSRSWSWLALQAKPWWRSRALWFKLNDWISPLKFGFQFRILEWNNFITVCCIRSVVGFISSPTYWIITWFIFWCLFNPYTTWLVHLSHCRSVRCCLNVACFNHKVRWSWNLAIRGPSITIGTFKPTTSRINIEKTTI